jgi:pyruvate dehydrogenase E1 component beta subunit
MVIVDSGFEGPQSSLSSLDEFASLTRAAVYFLSSKESIDKAFESASEPGLHLMALSQRNMKNICSSSQEVFLDHGDAIIYKYIPNSIKSKVAVVSFGASCMVAKEVAAELTQVSYSVSLVNMNRLVKLDFSSELFIEIAKHENIVIIDLGKSEIHFSSDLALRLKEYGKDVYLYQRNSSKDWSVVSDDALEFDAQSILQKVLRGNINEQG